MASLSRTLFRPARHALTRSTARAPRSLVVRGMATVGNAPPMEPQKERPREMAVGEFEGATFTIEPLRRVGEDEKTMRARLVYQSRKRGILETDLLLSTFADRYLPTMRREQMAEYDLFLDENDWDIYYWATQEEPSSTTSSSDTTTTDTSSASYGSSPETAAAVESSSSTGGRGAADRRRKDIHDDRPEPEPEPEPDPGPSNRRRRRPSTRASGRRRSAPSSPPTGPCPRVGGTARSCGSCETTCARARASGAGWRLCLRCGLKREGGYFVSQPATQS
ncbi:hypothetical protein CIB48_g9398 [Xylaria polymorpha]|nr:hypothetical protein CIB48_g9398 [Xylaria polymorpha]